jgi:predicted AAA+ superfamily ATPase
MDILEATFMVRQLRPWHENISKRQVKAPKLYFRDSGILHSLLEIPDKLALTRHPKLGASWEGFALEEVIRAGANESENLWFWATHGGAELDLLVIKGTRREGFEFKYTDRPATTRSMHIAIESLNLERLTVIYPGERRISLTEKIEAIGLAEFVQRTSTRVSA